jgi:hypothetical protein
MTLRIDTTREGRRVTCRLVGRIRGENLADLGRDLGSGGPVVVDLDEVTLVDVEAVRFLMDAEEAGVELRHCPRFIREWITREREVGRRDEGVRVVDARDTVRARPHDVAPLPGERARKGGTS